VPLTVRIAAVLAVLASARSAYADDARTAAPDPAMSAAMDRYFRGELREAASFLGVGIGTAFIGSALATRRDDFGIGAASAILPISAIEIGAGLVLLVRTEGQLAGLQALHAKDPAAYRAEELPRMERVNFWFDVYKGIEIGFIALGTASIVFGAVDDRDGFVGAGIGLASQASAMLTFDLIAEQRADDYTAKIDALTPSVRPVIGPTGIGLAGRF
jgi:hypothetical protein